MSIFDLPNFLLVLLSILVVPSFASSPCGTDQNPSCAGNDIFEQICCPAPNICYWQDRDGSPACCPAGQVCDGSSPYFPPTTTLYPSTITLTPAPAPTPTLHTTVTTYVGGGGVVVVTSPGGVVTVTVGNCGGLCSTVTSGAVGVYSTVTSGVVGIYTTVTSNVGGAFATVSGVLVGAAPRSSAVARCTPIMTALFALAWNNLG